MEHAIIFVAHNRAIMKKTLVLFAALLIAVSSLIARPQAVVFDFGGVLVGEPDREVIYQYIRSSLQLSNKEFEKANLEKMHAFKEGKTAVDVVFIDDKLENVDAAKTLGIDAVLFESADGIREELRKRGLLKN